MLRSAASVRWALQAVGCGGHALAQAQAQAQAWARAGGRGTGHEDGWRLDEVERRDSREAIFERSGPGRVALRLSGLK